MCIKQPGRRPVMRPRVLALLGLTVFLAPAMGGCLDQLGLGGLGRPDYHVSRTPLSSTDWTTDSSFVVQVQQLEPVEVVIEAVPTDGGATVTESGLSNA